jgi:4-oxalocrotonate tautomerase
MPFVTIKMYEGRTPEQKRELVRRVTDAVVRTTGATPEGTHVVIEDVKLEHWAIAGVLGSEAKQ